MDLRLTDRSFEKAGVFGKLTSLDKSCVVAFTLEHAFLNGDQVVAALTPGTYVCQRRLSPHFGCEVFQILNVPEHDFMELHWGNFNQDSKGCVLLGQSRSGDMLLHSRDSFNAFMNLQAGLLTFILVVE